MPRKTELIQAEEQAISSPRRSSRRLATDTTAKISTTGPLDKMEQDEKKPARGRRGSVPKEIPPETKAEPAKTRTRRLSAEPSVEEEKKPLITRRRRSSAVEESSEAEPAKSKSRRNSLSLEESTSQKPAGKSSSTEEPPEEETIRVTRRRRSVSADVEEKPVEKKPAARGRRQSTENQEVSEATSKPVTRTRRGSMEKSDELEPKTPKATKSRRRTSVSLDSIEEKTESKKSISPQLEETNITLTPYKEKKDTLKTDLNLSVIKEISFTDETETTEVASQDVNDKEDELLKVSTENEDKIQESPAVRRSPRLRNKETVSPIIDDIKSESKSPKGKKLDFKDTEVKEEDEKLSSNEIDSVKSAAENTETNDLSLKIEKKPKEEVKETPQEEVEAKNETLNSMSVGSDGSFKFELDTSLSKTNSQDSQENETLDLNTSTASSSSDKENVPTNVTEANKTDNIEVPLQEVTVARVSQVFRPKNIEYSFVEPMEVDESYLNDTKNKTEVDFNEGKAENVHLEKTDKTINMGMDETVDESFKLNLSVEQGEESENIDETSAKLGETDEQKVDDKQTIIEEKSSETVDPEKSKEIPENLKDEEQSIKTFEEATPNECTSNIPEEKNDNDKHLKLFQKSSEENQRIISREFSTPKSPDKNIIIKKLILTAEQQKLLDESPISESDHCKIIESPDYEFNIPSEDEVAGEKDKKEVIEISGKSNIEIEEVQSTEKCEIEVKESKSISCLDVTELMSSSEEINTTVEKNEEEIVENVLLNSQEVSHNKEPAAVESNQSEVAVEDNRSKVTKELAEELKALNNTTNKTLEENEATTNIDEAIGAKSNADEKEKEDTKEELEISLESLGDKNDELNSEDEIVKNVATETDTVVDKSEAAKTEIIEQVKDNKELGNIVEEQVPTVSSEEVLLDVEISPVKDLKSDETIEDSPNSNIENIVKDITRSDEPKEPVREKLELGLKELVVEEDKAYSENLINEEDKTEITTETEEIENRFNKTTSSLEVEIVDEEKKNEEAVKVLSDISNEVDSMKQSEVGEQIKDKKSRKKKKKERMLNDSLKVQISDESVQVQEQRSKKKRKKKAKTAELENESGDEVEYMDKSTESKKTESSNEEYKETSNVYEKLDKLLENIADEDSKDSEQIDNLNEFLDDMAEEGEEDTPSEGSNDIIDEGESIGETESDWESDEYDYEDSFIVDDEEAQLLSGEEYDLDNEATGKKKTRIINIEDRHEDVITIKKKEKPIKRKKKSRIITVSDSEDENQEKKIGTTEEEQPEDAVQEVKVGSEQITEESLTEKENEKPKLNKSTQKPMTSLLEEEAIPRRKSSITIHENINVNEIQDASLSERIHLLVDSFCTKIQKGDISMNLSLEYPGKEFQVSTSMKKKRKKHKKRSLSVSVDEPGEKKRRLSLSLKDKDPVLSKKESKRKRLSKSLETLSDAPVSNKKVKRDTSSGSKDQPLSIKNQLVTDVKNRPKRTVKPSVKTNTSWQVEKVSVKPSTSIITKKDIEEYQAKKLHPKDFRQKMLYDRSRVQRIDTKSMLKKRGAYY